LWRLLRACYEVMVEINCGDAFPLVVSGNEMREGCLILATGHVRELDYSNLHMDFVEHSQYSLRSNRSWLLEGKIERHRRRRTIRLRHGARKKEPTNEGSARAFLFSQMVACSRTADGALTLMSRLVPGVWERLSLLVGMPAHSSWMGFVPASLLTLRLHLSASACRRACIHRPHNLTSNGVVLRRLRRLFVVYLSETAEGNHQENPAAESYAIN
jgi:hypothetical protein